MRRIAISDIHGCLKTFRRLLEKKVILTKGDELYLLGDYIDRGPDSKGVIDYIMNLRKQGFSVKCLLGNHEEMLLKSMYMRDWEQTWLYNGGEETLESFGVKNVSDIPDLYINFIEELSHYHLVDKFILVHAGLSFKKGDPFRDKDSMLWARRWYHTLDYSWLASRIIIHGHTTLEKTAIQKMRENLNQLPILNIDAGCYKVLSIDKGQLCAYDMTDNKLYFQRNIDF